MERYGYLVLVNDDSGCKYINPTLFKSFTECMQKVIQDAHYNPECLCYFKILKNSEIFENIHSKVTERKFGYCFLSKSRDGDAYYIYNNASELENNLLASVLQAKQVVDQPRDIVGNLDSAKIKIGYYKILNTDDFVTELHV